MDDDRASIRVEEITDCKAIGVEVSFRKAILIGQQDREVSGVMGMLATVRVVVAAGGRETCRRVTLADRVYVETVEARCQAVNGDVNLGATLRAGQGRVADTGSGGIVKRHHSFAL